MIIDSNRIHLPKTKESIEWNNIKQIEFNNIKNINESLEIIVKQKDTSRKKINVPLVYDDYDDNGYLDYSRYVVELESVRTNKEKLYKLLIDLLKNSKRERELFITTLDINDLH